MAGHRMARPGVTRRGGGMETRDRAQGVVALVACLALLWLVALIVGAW